MAKAPKRAKRKERSDIFIYRLESGGYSADPSPFIIHRDLEEIQFRNLTSTDIRIQVKSRLLIPSTFTVKANTTMPPVKVNPSAKPGIYEYKAQIATPAGPPGVQQLPKTYAQGQSSPKMIVDT